MEVTMFYFKVLTQNLPWEIGDNHEKPQSGKLAYGIGFERLEYETLTTLV